MPKEAKQSKTYEDLHSTKNYGENLPDKGQE